jgi:MFS family permease
MAVPSPLRDRSVRLLLATQFLSAVGAFAQATALGKQVWDISGKELDLGLLGLVEFLPAALLVLVTGHVADRVDRRRLSAAGLVGEALAAVGLVVYLGGDPSSVSPIFGLAFLYGIARAFVAPAIRSLPANVAPPGTLPKVTAVNSAMWQAALITGPVLGGLLYAVTPTAPFVAAAALAAIASVLVLLVRIPPEVAEMQAAARAENEEEGLKDALQGLRFIRRTPLLLAAISLDLFAVLFGGAVALLPAIAEERLGVGAIGLGWLRAAGGVGAVIMAILLARRPVTHRVGRTLLVAVAIFGVATIVLGATTSFVVAFIAIAILSAADMVSVFIRATLVPLATPDEVRGRVMAAENVFIGASNELGAFESGVVGQALGPVGAIMSGGVATLVVVGVYWTRFPVLRNLDRFEELGTREAVAWQDAATSATILQETSWPSSSSPSAPPPSS